MAFLAMYSEITRKNVDAVLAFLPILSSKKANLYNIQTESLTLDPITILKNLKNSLKYFTKKILSFPLIGQLGRMKLNVSSYIQNC